MNSDNFPRRFSYRSKISRTCWSSPAACARSSSCRIPSTTIGSYNPPRCPRISSSESLSRSPSSGTSIRRWKCGGRLRLSHETIGHHLNSQERFQRPHHLPENRFIPVFEHDFPPHHPRNTMVKRTTFTQQTRSSHGLSLQITVQNNK